MKTVMSMKKQRLNKLLCGVLMLMLFMGLFGCAPLASLSEPAPAPIETNDDDGNSSNNSDNNNSKPSRDDDDDDDDDAIVASTVDTSSKYKFTVKGAFAGIDEYSEEPVVILVGEFTNNSDETISYGSALDAAAFQSGHELKDTYLRGASAYTYDKIEPGVTTPVLIGWKLVSASDSVEITVKDYYHYAKEVLFQKTYTVDELLKNTLEFLDEFEGVVDEDQAFAV